ncbi:hypothetical protein Dimus_015782, partial [Dionaea muscipula]
NSSPARGRAPPFMRGAAARRSLRTPLDRHANRLLAGGRAPLPAATPCCSQPWRGDPCVFVASPKPLRCSLSVFTARAPWALLAREMELAWTTTARPRHPSLLAAAARTED